MQHSYHEDFEGLLVRHDYAKRAGDLDRFAHEVTKYKSSIEMISGVVYQKNKATYDKVSYTKDDIIAISNMFCLYYMSLYSAKYNPNKRKKVIKRLLNENGKEPSEKAIERYDRHAMVRFIKHKHSRTKIICNSKSKNISVGKNNQLAFAETEKSVSAHPSEIIENYKKLGYRKVTKKELKEIEQNAGENVRKSLLDKNGFRVVKIDNFSAEMSPEEYSSIAIDNEFSQFYKSQDEIYSELNEGANIESYRYKFRKMPRDKKLETVKQFIKENKGKSYLSDELKAARKFLNSEIVV